MGRPAPGDLGPFLGLLGNALLGSWGEALGAHILVPRPQKAHRE